MSDCSLESGFMFSNPAANQSSTVRKISRSTFRENSLKKDCPQIRTLSLKMENFPLPCAISHISKGFVQEERNTASAGEFITEGGNVHTSYFKGVSINISN